MVNDDDLVVNIVIGVIMVIMLFISIWSIVAMLPSVNSHTHSKACYTEQGTLVCGKEDGELYLSQSHIPTVLDVLTYFEDKKSAE